MAAGPHKPDNLTFEVFIETRLGVLTEQLLELNVLIVARTDKDGEALEQHEGAVACGASQKDLLIGQVDSRLHHLHHGVGQRYVNCTLIILEDQTILYSLLVLPKDEVGADAARQVLKAEAAIMPNSDATGLTPLAVVGAENKVIVLVYTLE